MIAIFEKLYKRGFFIVLCLVCWVVYIVSAPWVWHQNIYLGLAFSLSLGLFVSNLLIYFQHETWHSYFETRWNRLLFNILCSIVFSQPHLYDVAHRSHHAKVNTYEDLEFYPIGQIHNKMMRVLCNFLSITLGSVFLLALGVNQPSGLKWQAAATRSVAALTATAVIWIGVGFASATFPGVTTSEILASYLFTIWLVSVFHHHNELIEHGNLIVEGDFRFRASQTRNLSSNGLLAKIFLFYVHQDSREHTLHHTEPSLYCRPFIGKHPMPDQAVYITFRQYFKILRAMLQGKSEVICQHATQK
jgi:fatty acid desaturase